MTFIETPINAARIPKNTVWLPRRGAKNLFKVVCKRNSIAFTFAHVSMVCTIQCMVYNFLAHSAYELLIVENEMDNV